MSKEIVKTDKAPMPIGPYSQAVKVSGDYVFTSGQIAIDPDTNEVIEGGIEDETRLVVNNLKNVLQAAGSDLEYVIKTTVYLKNMSDFSAMNAVYNEFFAEVKPARSTVEVSALPKNVLVEIDCIAVLK